MWKSIKKAWAYLGAMVGAKVEEKADPKIQLEQAIEEAKKRHEALTHQAATVLGNERQLELKLNRSLEEVEKLQGSARQALIQADQARASGDAARAKTFDDAAQSFAMKLVTEENTAREQKVLLDQADAASEGARKAVEMNALNLQKQLAERSKLLSQLDNAKMQERMNDALKQMDELSPSGDVPSIAQVRDKIESRYAKALGESDLRSGSVSSAMAEVEKAQIDSEAAARLASIRASLGSSDSNAGGVDAPSGSSGSSTIEVGQPLPDAEQPDETPAG